MRTRRWVMAALPALLVAGGCAPAVSVGECGGELPGFTHGTVQVAAARLHYVVGGTGSPVVLVHGFPETWATWRQIMPALAREHRVLAVDVRGAGCSSLEPAGYDKATLADDLHQLTLVLGMPRVSVVGHDMGGMTAYAWARRYRDQVERLVISGAGVPGFGLEELGPPHLATFAAPPGPLEHAVAGREREFLTKFVGDPAVARSGSLDEAVRAYSRPGRMTAAFAQYRALPRDAEDNRRGAAPPLAIPTLALSGGAPDLTVVSLRRVARNVRSVVIPGAGHYVQEDRPVEVAAALAAFLRD